MSLILKERLNINKSIWYLYEPFQKKFFKRWLWKFIITLLGVISPYFYKLLVDHVLIGRNPTVLWIVCIGTLGTYAVRRFFEYLVLRIDNSVNSLILDRLKSRIWRIYLKSDSEFSDRFSTGDLKNRIDADAEVCASFFPRQIMEYMINYIKCFAILLILFFINWKLAILSMIMVPVSFWFSKCLEKQIKQKSKQYRNLYGEYENWLGVTISGWKEIKALNANYEVAKRFDNYWDKLGQFAFAKQLYTCVNDVMHSFNHQFITQMNLYFIGGLLIFADEFSIGALLIFMAYYNKVFKSIKDIIKANVQFATDKPAIQKVLELFDYETYNLEGNLHLDGTVKFENVSFQYHSEQKLILDNVSFEVKEKECLAIIGKSGHGKTTLIKLLVGLYKPQKGLIQIGGIDLNNIPIYNLRETISVIMQDSKLFNMTIKENLLLVKSDATQEELERVCKEAQILDFIENLPLKFDTLIGERGVKLSGGQRQMLVLARMLLTTKEILILDEATSAMDNVAEEKIYQVLRSIAHKRTIIYITHRLSSLVLADRVLVLEDGKIVGLGTKDQLWEQNRDLGLSFPEDEM